MTGNRRFGSGGSLFAALLAAVAGGVERADGAPDEVRGTWLTTTGPDHIRSGFNTESVIGDLRGVGINTVYVETWKNGFTNFPSPTLDALTGFDRSTFLGSRDLVEETLVHAHRNEMNYIGWFEYGFSSQFIGNGGNPNNPLSNYMRNQGWLLQDQAGQFGNGSNGFAWMNPAVPEVRQFLIDITLEAVERYDLDGVQFDDRLSWPREFGWDATTAQLYFDETGRSLPSNVNDSNFRAWRQGKVTLFAEELTAAIAAVRPDLHVSVSPSVTNFSDVNFNAEWPEWQDDGLFDEYAVQVYRDNFDGGGLTEPFVNALPNQTAQFTPGDLDEFVVGLRGNGGGANTPIGDLLEMIELTRDIDAAGHAIFYSKAVRDDYRTQLQAFYDVANEGHAANPFFGADRRPAPIEALGSAGDEFGFLLTTGGRFRVVGRFGATWREIDTAVLGSGLQLILAPGADEVELLYDRRPLELGDYNGNGVVDAADFTLWRDTLSSATDLRADGDNDGVIGPGDLARWRAEFGQSASAPSAATPEPTSLGLLMLGMSVACGRRRARSIRSV